MGQRQPDLLAHRIALEVPGDVLADFLTALVFPEGLHQQLRVPAQDVAHLTGRRIRDDGPGPKGVCELAEQPRPAQATAPDHDPGTSGLLDHPHRVIRRPDVAVAQHRQWREILDESRDGLPLRFTRIHLQRRAGVQRHPCHAGICGDPGSVTVGQVVLVDAHPHLHRHRPAIGIGHSCTHDLLEQVQLPGQRGTTAAPRHLRNWAPHVEVDVVGHILLGHDPRRLRHNARVHPVQLDGARGLLRAEGAHGQGRLVTLQQGSGRDHLAYVEPGSVLTAQRAESTVRDPGHRCQDDRHVEGEIPQSQHRGRRWDSHPWTSSIAIRSCCIESRSRIVTALSSRESKSTVMQKGVPISSCRR